MNNKHYINIKSHTCTCACTTTKYFACKHAALLYVLSSYGLHGEAFKLIMFENSTILTPMDTRVVMDWKCLYICCFMVTCTPLLAYLYLLDLKSFTS